MLTYSIVFIDGNGVKKTAVSKGKSYLEAVASLKQRFGDKITIVGAELIRVD